MHNRLSMNNLPPLSGNTVLSNNLSMTGLPPLSPVKSLDVAGNPVGNPMSLSMLGLPPLPVSPRVAQSSVPVFSSVVSAPIVSSSPVSSSPISSTNLSMSGLPPLPTSPRVSVRSAIPEERVHLASVSVPIYKVWPQLGSEEHLNEILSLPLYDIPTLEEVLAKTTQPFLREKLQRMIVEQRQYEGRGSHLRGWASRSPQRGRARNELMGQCGPSCFLDPVNKKFPICPKCQLGDGKCSCAIDCAALNAAKIRTRQWGYESIAELADKLLKEKCQQTSPRTSPRSGRVSPRGSPRYFQQ